MAAGVAKGDVRLYKSQPPDKKRPVLVLTRDSAIPYLTSVTVAPITSTIRGVPFEVLLSEEHGMKSACVKNLHNLITLPQVRIGRHVARLNSTRMAEIWAALQFSRGCI